MYGSGQTGPDAGEIVFLHGVSAAGFVMVTTKSLRHFAADCLAWALKEDDPNKKQMLVTAARSWAVTADEIDRQAELERAAVLPDLKSKLN
jgi:hypothetical protein